ncbi:Protein kinase domain [Dillenia turbinata]|uniref:Protein kinase domain n=1 Tax=Dillenia turbinata TaxID=194707 RepID=A0AAN8VIV9_9MAGN
MWSRGRLLGKGSFGVVSMAISDPNHRFRCCFHHHLPHVMAAKSADITRSHSLEKEMKFLTLFKDSPHVLGFYGADITRENGEIFFNLLLEYASGGSLADLIKRGGGAGLPEVKVRSFTKSILMGLSHIHGLGYVHCDIKPHNILLTTDSMQEEVVKLADFGLTKKAGTDYKVEKSGSGLRGTPLYIAPESILKREYEPHSDIWSLGCTILEMITGKPAWKMAENTETCALVFKIGFTQELPEIPSRVSREAADFVRKCLLRDPKQRWTAEMLLQHPFVTEKVRWERELE